MSRKYFGTDGIRGCVGNGVITPEFFLHLGWAVGKVLAKKDSNGSSGMVLIGKDTRISGYMLESALEAGLISAGVDVGLLGPMPTPAIAYLTRTFQARAGIVISASHNPYMDNGIKLFNTDGTKLDDAVELAIEAQLEQKMQTESRLGKARRIDAEGRYIEFCKASLPWGFSLEGMKVVLDCANGATYNVAPKVFRELGANVTAIGIEPNGLNINLDCGSTKMNMLQKAVLEQSADLGIAFDGDGDRVMFVDHCGEIVDGDQLLYIIASHRAAHSSAGCSGVVGTLMSNFGFELGMKSLGIPFERAKVGDRYVIEAMKRNNWFVGGESSGHIVCSDVTTTGDGIISALQVLKAVTAEHQSLHDLKQRMQKMPQVMINVPVKQKVDIDSHTEVQKEIDAAEAQMDGKGRVLLRPSGTEPVIRVMVEGQHHGQVSELARRLADVVGSAVA